MASYKAICRRELKLGPTTLCLLTFDFDLGAFVRLESQVSYSQAGRLDLYLVDDFVLGDFPGLRQLI